jgi:D-serine deaminase-like pyridoxal phosphate-dependent protein
LPLITRPHKANSFRICARRVTVQGVQAERDQDSLTHRGLVAEAPRRPVRPAPARPTAGENRTRFDGATAAFDPPFAIVDYDAFDANAQALVARAAGKPIRVASKSVRCRELLCDVLARPGWHGVMAFTLPEAIWLVTTGVTDDVLLGYPTAHRAALAELAGSEQLAPRSRSWSTASSSSTRSTRGAPGPAPGAADLPGPRRLLATARGRAHIGVRRSPLHSAAAIGALAATVAARPGFRLVGVMSYEAQIAGLGDAPPGRPVYGRLLRLVQKRSLRDLLGRRAAAVAAARQHADLEFVNGGGTGSIAATAADTAVTEVTAGSGLYGPTLFDAYTAWRPIPSAYFATSVVRRPGPHLVTVHGGGWIASGPGEFSRLPRPVLPAGLRLLGAEGAARCRRRCRAGGRRADAGRPGLVPPRQGGRAVRARGRPAPGAGLDRGAQRAHVPRRARPRVPLTTSSSFR